MLLRIYRCTGVFQKLLDEIETNLNANDSQIDLPLTGWSVEESATKSSPTWSKDPISQKYDHIAQTEIENRVYSGAFLFPSPSQDWNE
jgi:hypothetical protein